MKKIFLILLLFIVAACGTTSKSTDTTYASGTRMMATIDTINVHQLDSLCAVDTLGRNLESRWLKYESLNNKREYVCKYVYIKYLGDEEKVYTLYPYQDTLYILNKRWTK